MKKSFFLYAFLLTTGAIRSQTKELPWNIGLQGGIIQYNGDRGQNFYFTDQAVYGFGGVSVSRYLGRHFDASLWATRAELGNIEPTNPAHSSNGNGNGNGHHPPEEHHFRIQMNTATLALRFNFTAPEATVRPYIYAGGSAIMYENRYSLNSEEYDYKIPSFGGGFTFRVTDIISLYIQESFMYTGKDDIDGEVREYNDSYVFHTAGLTFNLGKKKDEDRDRVSDNQDKCPNTPVGIGVDKNGCPFDTDLDEVPDYMDQCPEAGGLASLQGCPDSDEDGIADKTDRCPHSAGSADLQGCPDSDNDGIADLDDNCPGTNGRYKVDASGCPLDADKDGTINEDDRCPDIPGLLHLKGCPDQDNDGISDLDDLCPDIIGLAENKGCPEMNKEDADKITSLAGKISFNTNSEMLTRASLAQLDMLAGMLEKYKAANLVISVPANGKGDQHGMELSRKRAEALKNYLILKGISDSRLMVSGQTELKQSSKNGKVELKISY